jgi:hypothetical protein
MQTRTSGGSSDTEVIALAVLPNGVSFTSVAPTTATPVAKWPIAVRNRAAGTCESSRPSGTGAANG